jgi:hypothetical protein
LIALGAVDIQNRHAAADQGFEAALKLSGPVAGEEHFLGRKEGRMGGPEHHRRQRLAGVVLDAGDGEVRIGGEPAPAVAVPAGQLRAARAHLHGRELPGRRGDDFRQLGDNVIKRLLVEQADLRNAERVLGM